MYDGKVLKVEWGEQPYEPSPEESAKVRAVYVGNLGSEVNTYMLRSKFEAYGKLFHVQKVRDYAFIHYEEREAAETGKILQCFFSNMLYAPVKCSRLDQTETYRHVNLSDTVQYPMFVKLGTFLV